MNKLSMTVATTAAIVTMTGCTSPQQQAVKPSTSKPSQATQERLSFSPLSWVEETCFEYSNPEEPPTEERGWRSSPVHRVRLVAAPERVGRDRSGVLDSCNTLKDVRAGVGRKLDMGFSNFTVVAEAPTDFSEHRGNVTMEMRVLECEARGGVTRCHVEGLPTLGAVYVVEEKYSLPKK